MIHVLSGNLGILKGHLEKACITKFHMPHVKLTSGHWNRLRLSGLFFQQIGTQSHFIRRDLVQMENFMQLMIQEHKEQSIWVAAMQTVPCFTVDMVHQ